MSDLNVAMAVLVAAAWTVAELSSDPKALKSEGANFLLSTKQPTDTDSDELIRRAMKGDPS